MDTPIERMKRSIKVAKKSNVNKYDFWWRHFIAKNILVKKYYHDNELAIFNKGGTDNEDIAFDTFVERVASICGDDDIAKNFVIDSLYRGDFILAGRSLYGAGAKGKFKSSMSNCYILPSPKDNLESIFDTAKEMARIFSYGGGCGVDISNLRPRESKVHNTAKTSTGSVSFMNLFSIVGEVIGAHGRRSALLIALNCNHPDIEDFLEVKQNNSKIQMANISIKFTDDFMQAVRSNKDVNLYFKVKATGEVISKTINAREFFMKFAKAQHSFAEPGAIFINHVREWNMLSEYDYNIEVSNPCSEFFGNAYNSCNLSSINLYNFVNNPFTRNATFDYKRFKETVTNAVTVANYVLNYGYETQPLEQNKKCIDDWRSIGIGVFGIADMFVAMGYKYGSKESIELIGDIMKHMQVYAFESSMTYAKQFKAFDKFDYQLTLKSVYVKELIKNYAEVYDMPTDECRDFIYKKLLDNGLANGTLLSIAPTGSIAMLFRESGGVEPYYQTYYERTTHQLEKQHKKFSISMLAVEHLLKSNVLTADKVLGQDITEKEIKEMFPWVVNTYDVKPKERIDLQSEMQMYVDNAISSTINLKEEATVDEIFDLYIYAWIHNCKGITVFRDNCERISILGKDHGKTRDNQEDKSLDENKSTNTDNKVTQQILPANLANKPCLDSIMPHKRGAGTALWGRTFLYHTACVPKFYVTVNIKDGELFEVFVGADKGCQANISTITRLTSLCLRSGVKVEEVIKNLNSALCPACANQKRKGDLTINKSCASCVASALIEMQKSLNGGKANNKEDVSQNFIEVKTVPKEIKMVKVSQDKPKLAECPECHQHTLIPDGKCIYCSNCGYSKCD